MGVAQVDLSLTGQRGRLTPMRAQPILVGVILLAVASCSPPKQDIDPRAARIRAEFGLTGPYRIESRAPFQFTVRGTNFKSRSFNWDHSWDHSEHGTPEDWWRPRAVRDLLAVDTIPKLIHLGTRDKDEGALPLGSDRELAVLDMLTMAAEHELGRELVARIDSAHAVGSIKAFAGIRQTLNETQRQYAMAVSLAWSLRRQRERGYWLPANAGSIDSSRGYPRYIFK